jgi:hypothetical protein
MFVFLTFTAPRGVETNPPVPTTLSVVSRPAPGVLLGKKAASLKELPGQSVEK